MSGLTVEQFAPGNPGAILALKDQVHRTAQRTEDSQRELKAVLAGRAQVSWEGFHVERFRQTTESLPHDLGLMASSYFRAAHALRVYGETLGSLQVEVRAAINRANQAEARRDAARRARDVAENQRRSFESQLASARSQLAAVSTSSADTSTPEGAAAAQAAAEAAAAIQRQIDDLHRQLAQAVAERDRQAALATRAEAELQAELRRLNGLAGQRRDAEQRCARMLHDALEGELRNRSLVNQFVGSAVGKAAVLGVFGPVPLLLRGVLATRGVGRWSASSIAGSREFGLRRSTSGSTAFGGVRGGYEASALFGGSVQGDVGVRRTATSVSANAEASGSLGFAARASGNLGAGPLKVGGETKAFVGARGDASAGITAGITGIEAKAAAGGFVGAEVGVEGTAELAGVKAKGGVNGYAGFGARAEGSGSLGLNKVGVAVDVSAALGIGMGVKFDVSVSPKETFNKVKGLFR